MHPSWGGRLSDQFSDSQRRKAKLLLCPVLPMTQYNSCLHSTGPSQSTRGTVQAEEQPWSLTTLAVDREVPGLSDSCSSRLCPGSVVLALCTSRPGAQRPVGQLGAACAAFLPGLYLLPSHGAPGCSRCPHLCRQPPLGGLPQCYLWGQPPRGPVLTLCLLCCSPWDGGGAVKRTCHGGL